MGKVVAGVMLAFVALVAYIVMFGKPNTKPIEADPQKVVGAAGDAGHVVADVGEPWWQWFFAQPWAVPVILSGLAAAAGIWWWRGLNGTARVITAVAATFVIVVVAIGLAQ